MKMRETEIDIENVLTGFQGHYFHENGEYPSALEIAKHFYKMGLETGNSIVSDHEDVTNAILGELAYVMNDVESYEELTDAEKEIWTEEVFNKVFSK